MQVPGGKFRRPPPWVSLAGKAGESAVTQRRRQAVSDTDKISNKAEELKGKVKEGVGDATDNEQLQGEGKVDQAKGNLKQAGEKVKDAVKGVTN
jgi:uncharacterized protein YjbJ (UPF0337 family)